MHDGPAHNAGKQEFTHGMKWKYGFFGLMILSSIIIEEILGRRS
jgi:hypothetical protein